LFCILMPALRSQRPERSRRPTLIVAGPALPVFKEALASSNAI